MFDIVVSKKISEVVIDQIQKKIISGELKEGDQLPPEREMIQDMGISRSTLREALKALEVMGVIESRQGNGNFVVNNTENSVFKPLSLAFVLSEGKDSDIFEARLAVESFNAQQAALKATEEDIKMLYEIHNNIIQAETDAEKIKFDSELHYKIAKICDNVIIVLFLKGISYVFDNFLRQVLQRAFDESDSYNVVYKEHERILRAIEAKDPDEARLAMVDHLNQIKKEWYR